MTVDCHNVGSSKNLGTGGMPVNRYYINYNTLWDIVKSLNGSSRIYTDFEEFLSCILSDKGKV